MSPKISIIIPVLNEREALKELLEDVKGFEFTDYEVIVVDGGSEDGTREVAEEFGVRLVNGPQEGMAAARNKGLEEAKGEYILMADADFRFPEGISDEMIRHMEDGKDMIFFKTDWHSGERTFAEKVSVAEHEVNWNDAYLVRILEEVVSWLV